MNPKRSFVLMEGVPGAAGGGAAGAGGEGGQEGAGAAGANAGAGSGGAGGGAAGAAGGAGASALSGNGSPPPLHERIPEKFHVKRTGEKGEEFDADASWGKVLEGYQALEKRVGSGDLPPKAPEEYAITVPDALKETFKEDERTAALRKDAHEAGLNQKQFDFMMGKFFQIGPELAQAAVQNSVEQTRGALEKAWGDKYDEQFSGAFKAFQAYAPEGVKFDDIMTNPAIAYQLLAKIAPELGEAGGVPGNTSGGQGESVDDLMKSEAYWNSKHADHAKVSAKVRAHYERKHGTAAVT